MQLQKRFNRKVGDKEYSKWQVVIPPETIEKLGWKEGEELSDFVDEHGQKLMLMPTTKVIKSSLEQARHAVQRKKRKASDE